MLECPDENRCARLAAEITDLKCQIALPEAWAGLSRASGPARLHMPEARRCPRWNNAALAGLFYRQTFAVIPRPEQRYPVYVGDVSRSGCSFIHFEQLYPLERMHVLFLDDVTRRLLQDKRYRAIEVARCRFVQQSCYEIGVRFLDCLSQ